MKHNQALKKYTTDLIDDFENPGMSFNNFTNFAKYIENNSVKQKYLKFR